MLWPLGSVDNNGSGLHLYFGGKSSLALPLFFFSSLTLLVKINFPELWSSLGHSVSSSVSREANTVQLAILPDCWVGRRQKAAPSWCWRHSSQGIAFRCPASGGAFPVITVCRRLSWWRAFPKGTYQCLSKWLLVTSKLKSSVFYFI